MLACSLSPCRMYTRNTSLAEKAWKERREVFMLLFTKKKQKQKKKLLLKDWLVISRNQHVEFFFPPVNLELVRDWSLNYFVLHAVESGCVYASSRVEGVSGAVGLKPCVLFFFFLVQFLKCYLWEVKEERLTEHKSVVTATWHQLAVLMLSN